MLEFLVFPSDILPIYSSEAKLVFEKSTKFSGKFIFLVY